MPISDMIGRTTTTTQNQTHHSGFGGRGPISAARATLGTATSAIRTTNGAAEAEAEAEDTDTYGGAGVAADDREDEAPPGTNVADTVEGEGSADKADWGRRRDEAADAASDAADIEADAATALVTSLTSRTELTRTIS